MCNKLILIALFIVILKSQQVYIGFKDNQEIIEQYDKTYSYLHNSNSYMLGIKTSESKLFKFQTGIFWEHQSFTDRGGSRSLFFQTNEKSYLAISDTTDSKIYKEDSAGQFQEFQTIAGQIVAFLEVKNSENQDGENIPEEKLVVAVDQANTSVLFKIFSLNSAKDGFEDRFDALTITTPISKLKNVYFQKFDTSQIFFVGLNSPSSIYSFKTYQWSDSTKIFEEKVALDVQGIDIQFSNLVNKKVLYVFQTSVIKLYQFTVDAITPMFDVTVSGVQIVNINPFKFKFQEYLAISTNISTKIYKYDQDTTNFADENVDLSIVSKNWSYVDSSNQQYLVGLGISTVQVQKIISADPPAFVSTKSKSQITTIGVTKTDQTIAKNLQFFFELRKEAAASSSQDFLKIYLLSISGNLDLIQSVSNAAMNDFTSVSNSAGGYVFVLQNNSEILAYGLNEDNLFSQIGDKVPIGSYTNLQKVYGIRVYELIYLVFYDTDTSKKIIVFKAEIQETALIVTEVQDWVVDKFINIIIAQMDTTYYLSILTEDKLLLHKYANNKFSDTADKQFTKSGETLKDVSFMYVNNEGLFGILTNLNLLIYDFKISTQNLSLLNNFSIANGSTVKNLRFEDLYYYVVSQSCPSGCEILYYQYNQVQFTKKHSQSASNLIFIESIVYDTNAFVVAGFQSSLDLHVLISSKYTRDMQLFSDQLPNADATVTGGQSFIVDGTQYLAMRSGAKTNIYVQIGEYVLLKEMNVASDVMKVFEYDGNVYFCVKERLFQWNKATAQFDLIGTLFKADTCNIFFTSGGIYEVVDHNLVYVFKLNTATKMFQNIFNLPQDNSSITDLMVSDRGIEVFVIDQLDQTRVDFTTETPTPGQTCNPPVTVCSPLMKETDVYYKKCGWGVTTRCLSTSQCYSTNGIDPPNIDKCCVKNDDSNCIPPSRLLSADDDDNDFNYFDEENSFGNLNEKIEGYENNNQYDQEQDQFEKQDYYYIQNQHRNLPPASDPDDDDDDDDDDGEVTSPYTNCDDLESSAFSSCCKKRDVNLNMYYTKHISSCWYFINEFNLQQKLMYWDQATETLKPRVTVQMNQLMTGQSIAFGNQIFMVIKNRSNQYTVYKINAANQLIQLHMLAIEATCPSVKFFEFDNNLYLVTASVAGITSKIFYFDQITQTFKQLNGWECCQSDNVEYWNVFKANSILYLNSSSGKSFQVLFQRFQPYYALEEETFSSQYTKQLGESVMSQTSWSFTYQNTYGIGKQKILYFIDNISAFSFKGLPLPVSQTIWIKFNPIQMKFSGISPDLAEGTKLVVTLRLSDGLSYYTGVQFTFKMTLNDQVLSKFTTNNSVQSESAFFDGFWGKSVISNLEDYIYVADNFYKQAINVLSVDAIQSVAQVNSYPYKSGTEIQDMAFNPFSPFLYVISGNLLSIYKKVDDTLEFQDIDTSAITDIQAIKFLEKLQILLVIRRTGTNTIVQAYNVANPIQLILISESIIVQAGDFIIYKAVIYDKYLVCAQGSFGIVFYDINLISNIQYYHKIDGYFSDLQIGYQDDSVATAYVVFEKQKIKILNIKNPQSTTDLLSVPLYYQEHINSMYISPAFSYLFVGFAFLETEAYSIKDYKFPILLKSIPEFSRNILMNRMESSVFIGKKNFFSIKLNFSRLSQLTLSTMIKSNTPYSGSIEPQNLFVSFDDLSLYVGSSSNQVQKFDITDIDSISYVSSYSFHLIGQSSDRRYLYGKVGAMFNIYDLADSSYVGQPTFKGGLAVGTADVYQSDIDQNSEYFYLCAGKVTVINIKDPTDPKKEFEITGSSKGFTDIRALTLFLVDDLQHIALADYEKGMIFGKIISNSQIQYISSVLPNMKWCSYITVLDGYAYASLKTIGLAILDIKNFASIEVLQVYGESNPLQFKIFNFGLYGILSTGRGCKIFDLKKPVNSKVMWFLQWNSDDKDHGIAIQGSNAFVSSNGIKLIKLSAEIRMSYFINPQKYIKPKKYDVAFNPIDVYKKIEYSGAKLVSIKMLEGTSSEISVALPGWMTVDYQAKQVIMQPASSSDINGSVVLRVDVSKEIQTIEMNGLGTGTNSEIMNELIAQDILTSDGFVSQNYDNKKIYELGLDINLTNLQRKLDSFIFINKVALHFDDFVDVNAAPEYKTPLQEQFDAFVGAAKVERSIRFQISNDTFVDPDDLDIEYFMEKYETTYQNGTKVETLFKDQNWAVFFAEQKLLVGTPPVEFLDTKIEFTLIATDEYNKEEGQFTIDLFDKSPIYNKKNSMQIQFDMKFPDLKVEEDFLITFDETTFTDEDDNDLIYSLEKIEITEQDGELVLLIDNLSSISWINFQSLEKRIIGKIPVTYIDRKVEFFITVSDKYKQAEGSFKIDLLNVKPDCQQDNKIQDQFDSKIGKPQINRKYVFQFDASTCLDPDDPEINYKITSIEVFKNNNLESTIDETQVLLLTWFSFSSDERRIVFTPPDIYIDKVLKLNIEAKDRFKNDSTSFKFDLFDNPPVYNTQNNMQYQFNGLNLKVKVNQSFEFQFQDDTFIDKDDADLEYKVTKIEVIDIETRNVLESFNNLNQIDYIEFGYRRFTGNFTEIFLDKVVKFYVLATDGYKEDEGFVEIDLSNKPPEVFYKLQGQFDFQIGKPNIGQEFVFQFQETSFIDPDDPILDYKITKIVVIDPKGEVENEYDDIELVNWINFDPITRRFTGTFQVEDQDKDIKITVQASDGTKTIDQTFNIDLYNEVIVYNQDNNLEKQFDRKTSNIVVGQEFIFQIDSNTFVDKEGTALAYSMVSVEILDGETKNSEQIIEFSKVSWCTFNSKNILLICIPPKEMIDKILNIKMMAEDKGKKQFGEFQVNLNNPGPKVGKSIQELVDIAVNKDNNNPKPFHPFSFTFNSEMFSVDNPSLSLSYRAFISGNVTSSQNRLLQEGQGQQQTDGEQGNQSNDDPYKDEKEVTQYSDTWIKFDKSQKRFYGTPTKYDIGDLKIKVAAHDGLKYIEQNFVLTTKNQAPQTNILLQDQMKEIKVNIDEEFEFTFKKNTFIDNDNDTLVYKTSEMGQETLPTFVRFDPATRQFAGTPTALLKPIISVIATDPSGYFVEDTFKIVVNTTIMYWVKKLMALEIVFLSLSSGFSAWMFLKKHIYKEFCPKKYKKSKILKVQDENLICNLILIYSQTVMAQHLYKIIYKKEKRNYLWAFDENKTCVSDEKIDEAIQKYDLEYDHKYKHQICTIIKYQVLKQFFKDYRQYQVRKIYLAVKKYLKNEPQKFRMFISDIIYDDIVEYDNETNQLLEVKFPKIVLNNYKLQIMFQNIEGIEELGKVRPLLKEYISYKALGIGLKHVSLKSTIVQALTFPDCQFGDCLYMEQKDVQKNNIIVTKRIFVDGVARQEEVGNLDFCDLVEVTYIQNILTFKASPTIKSNVHSIQIYNPDGYIIKEFEFQKENAVAEKEWGKKLTKTEVNRQILRTALEKENSEVKQIGVDTSGSSLSSDEEGKQDLEEFDHLGLLIDDDNNQHITTQQIQVSSSRSQLALLDSTRKDQNKFLNLNKKKAKKQNEESNSKIQLTLGDDSYGLTVNDSISSNERLKIDNSNTTIFNSQRQPFNLKQPSLVVLEEADSLVSTLNEDQFKSAKEQGLQQGDFPLLAQNQEQRYDLIQSQDIQSVMVIDNQQTSKNENEQKIQRLRQNIGKLQQDIRQSQTYHKQQSFGLEQPSQIINMQAISENYQSSYQNKDSIPTITDISSINQNMNKSPTSAHVQSIMLAQEDIIPQTEELEVQKEAVIKSDNPTQQQESQKGDEQEQIMVEQSASDIEKNQNNLSLQELEIDQQENQQQQKSEYIYDQQQVVDIKQVNFENKEKMQIDEKQEQLQDIQLIEDVENNQSAWNVLKNSDSQDQKVPIIDTEQNVEEEVKESETIDIANDYENCNSLKVSSNSDLQLKKKLIINDQLVISQNNSPDTGKEDQFFVAKNPEQSPDGVRQYRKQQTLNKPKSIFSSIQDTDVIKTEEQKQRDKKQQNKKKTLLDVYKQVPIKLTEKKNKKKKTYQLSKEEQAKLKK